MLFEVTQGKYVCKSQQESDVQIYITNFPSAYIISDQSAHCQDEGREMKMCPIPDGSIVM